jgi:hypothetical protein
VDLSKILHKLYAEKDGVVQAIAALEELRRDRAGQSLPSSKRRGRKSMGAEERQEVSERMKRYWASRRNRRQSSQK